MATATLEKTAFTLEQFLNACGLPDGPARTAIEARLVDYLQQGQPKKDYVVYHAQQLSCYHAGVQKKYFPVSEATRTLVIWTDGRQISRLDGAAFANNGQLVMLGAAGLGISSAAAARQKEKNSNNNNNNNNNG
ncbi:hypothetical protein [Chitinilyticum aquatile]|uniref:hypothetical protein n=1 Tax=Chitinilyticum aquatile TaxID=362520 RepID=UPI0003FA0212|nr:hypothetical protein [Chitinilyticum aquatile]